LRLPMVLQLFSVCAAAPSKADLECLEHDSKYAGTVASEYDDDEETTVTASGSSCSEDVTAEEGDSPMTALLGALKAILLQPAPLEDPSQLPRNRQTVIFLDWDDTLLCTTYLSSRRETGVTSDVELRLTSIASRVARLLELALDLGKVFIVTNAEEGWVEASAELYLPSLVQALEGVPILSARSRFEPEYPDETSVWKTKAFLEVRNHMNTHVFANVISLGDSPFEMAAARSLARRFDKALVKTIRFKVHPSPDELLEELEFCIDKLVGIERNLENVSIRF